MAIQYIDIKKEILLENDGLAEELRHRLRSRRSPQSRHLRDRERPAAPGTRQKTGRFPLCRRPVWANGRSWRMQAPSRF